MSEENPIDGWSFAGNIIVIHGVGSPSPGEISNPVRQLLSDAGLLGPLEELNWNQLSEQPLNARGNLRVGPLATLSKVLSVASYIQSEETAPPPSPFSYHQVSFWRTLHKMSFMIADLTLTFSFLVTLTVPIAWWLSQLGASILLKERTQVGQAVAAAGFGTASAALHAALFLAAVFLFVSIGFTLVTADSSEAFVALRRLLTLFLRPALFAITVPLLLPWRSLTRKIFVSTPKVLVAVTFVIIVYPVFISFIVNSARAELLMHALGPTIFKIVEALAFAVLGATFVYALGPGLKVLLDIFRYAADEDYRKSIHDLVRETVKRTNKDHRGVFYILGHSLGSIIAIDVLLNCDVFASTDQITLITMGSPVKRFFFRFFPNLLFPSGGTRCAQALSSRFQSFRWINCYRPFDQIGTRVGLPTCLWAREVSTGQFSKILKAHINYWNDPAVADALISSCCSVNYSNERSTNPSAQNDRGTITTTDLRLQWVKLMWMLTSLVVGGTSIIGLISAVHPYREESKSSEIQLSKIQTQGLLTTADVTYIYTPIASDETGPIVYADQLKFFYTTPDGSSQQLEFEEYGFLVSPYDPSQISLDFKGLVKTVKANGNHLKVAIRYLPERPKLIFVPDFPPRPRHDAVVISGIILTLFLVMLTGVATIVTYYVSAIVGELFVGDAILSESFFGEDNRKSALRRKQSQGVSLFPRP